MKYMTMSVDDYVSVEDSTIDIENCPHSKDTPTTTTTLNLAIKVDNKNFQEHCYGVFVQMAKNNSIMVKNFEKTNASSERVGR